MISPLTSRATYVFNAFKQDRPGHCQEFLIVYSGPKFDEVLKDDLHAKDIEGFMDPTTRYWNIVVRTDQRLRVEQLENTIKRYSDSKTSLENKIILRRTFGEETDIVTLSQKKGAH